LYTFAIFLGPLVDRELRCSLPAKEGTAMSNRENSEREHPSTYFVQDRHNVEELKRLQIQDEMLTKSLGGVLPEQPDPSILQRILDVGCGTGGWLIAVARAYPCIKLLVGVDVSRTFVTYARTQAHAAQVSDRVEFHVMDALRMIEFPSDYFDLVNLRLSSSFMRTWDWPKLLTEMKRVVRHAGVVRISDMEVNAQSTSPALTRLYERFRQALYRAGHLFEDDPCGLTTHLGRLLVQEGYQQVQVKSFELVYRAGTPEGEACYEDAKSIFQTLRPFIHKWGCAGSAYDILYRQMLSEMSQSDFQGTWRMWTARGIRPATSPEGRGAR
jgi:ubiquinone/menaquinone biosynthesis C-methylase UbiE